MHSVAVVGHVTGGLTSGRELYLIAAGLLGEARVDIACRRFRLNPDLHAYCERSLRFALERFELRLERVSAVLSDVNGPRGGLDQACRLLVDIVGGRRLVVESMEASAFAAGDVAADRARQTVARELDRWRWRLAPV